MPAELYYVAPEVKAYFAKRREKLSKDYNDWVKVFEAWKSANPKLAKELSVSSALIRNVCSGLAAAILASHTSAATGQPTLGGYTLVLWVAGGICVVAAVLAWVLPTRGQPAPGPRLDAAEVRLLEETDGEDLVAGPGPA